MTWMWHAGEMPAQYSSACHCAKSSLCCHDLPLKWHFFFVLKVLLRKEHNKWRGEEVDEEVAGWTYWLWVQRETPLISCSFCIINSPSSILHFSSCFFCVSALAALVTCFSTRENLTNFHNTVLPLECCFGPTLWAPRSCRLIWSRLRIAMISPNEGLCFCHRSSKFTQGKANATLSDPWMNPGLWFRSKSWAENNLFAWWIKFWDF